jgi:hypothetical protein
MVWVHPTVVGGHAGVVIPTEASALESVPVSLVFKRGRFWRLKLELQAALSFLIVLVKVTLLEPVKTNGPESLSIQSKPARHASRSRIVASSSVSMTVGVVEIDDWDDRGDDRERQVRAKDRQWGW